MKLKKLSITILYVFLTCSIAFSSPLTSGPVGGGSGVGGGAYDSTNVAITGGTINGVAITGSSGTFTTLASDTFHAHQGSDVASANDMTLGDGNLFDITGTTTINTIVTKGIGTIVVLEFDGVLQLTHSNDLFLPTAANITTAAGDIAAFYEYASGDWRCMNYMRANGTTLVDYQPLEATLTDIADGTIDENLINTAYPWAINEGGTGQSTAANAFGALKQDATTAATGVVELATDAETVTGAATDKVTTPANITAKMAAPGAIGGTTPAAGTFTTITSIPDGTNETFQVNDGSLDFTDGNAGTTGTLTVDASGNIGYNKAIGSVQYKTIWIPAVSMTPRQTNGPSVGTYEYATNDVNSDYLAFDDGTEEFADFKFPMPEDWDRSTIKVKFYWSSATGSTANDTVEWQIAGQAKSDSDALDVAYGDAGEVISDTLLADNGGDLQLSSATPEVTIGGTPALGDLIHFTTSRNVGGTDDMTEDAWLFGVWIQYQATELVTAW